MLKNSDIAPTKIEVLEEIINLPKQSQKLKQNIPKFRLWLEALFQYLTKEEKEEIVTNLISTGDSTKKYYNYLQKFLKNPGSLSSFNQVNHLIYKIEIIYYFETLMDALCTNSKSKSLELKDSIQQEEITKIYKMFLEAYGNLFNTLYQIENTLYEINVEKWEKITLNSTDVKCAIVGATALNENITIPGTQFVLAGFSNDSSKLYKIDKAFLFKTDKRIGDYGFLYDFSKEIIYNEDLSDVASDNWYNDKLSRLYQSLLTGELLETTSYACEGAIWDLDPLYNLDEILAETEEYEIKLRMGSKPFAIFVWKEKLEVHKKMIDAIRIAYGLPLLVFDNCRIEVISD